MQYEKARSSPPMRLISRKAPGQSRICGVEHSGSTLHAQPGQRFIVRLYEIPSGDHRWLMDTTAGLKVVDSWYVPQNLDRPLAGGWHMWSIRVQAIGEHSVHAKLHGLSYLSRGSELQFSLRILAD